MSDPELANQCMVTAISLLRDEIDGETWAGDLYLRPGDGETWDVHKRDAASVDLPSEGKHRGELLR